jgi:hypothetical protein
MTVQYKTDFDKLEWESPIEGVRHKYIDQNNLRIRLVEYSKEMHPIGVKRDIMAISLKAKWKLNMKIQK